MTVQEKRPRWAIALALLAGAFGIVTLKSGGEVLFIDGAGRQAAGDYVPFVLWFNFLAGFAYIAGAVGLALWRSWVVPLAFTIMALSVLVFAAFGVWILIGEVFEIRTVGAMTLRCLVWLGIALALRGKFKRAV
jgi:hypothetical protein